MSGARIRLLVVGRVKESFYRDAIAEYQKRLGRYCQLHITEVADEPTPDNASDKESLAIKEKESDRLLRQISDRDYVIALSIAGKRRNSEGMASHLEELILAGKSQLTFVIGGSLGLSQKLLRRADEELSFSDFTFPHQLMRVILMEQIYRAFRIQRGEPYHK